MRKRDVAKMDIGDRVVFCENKPRGVSPSFFGELGVMDIDQLHERVYFMLSNGYWYDYRCIVKA